MSKTGRRKDVRTRSAISNGSTLFLGDVDGRSDVARRYADLQSDLIAERGGADVLPVAHREAIRTYAGLAIQRDLMHARLARGEAVDPEAMGQIGDRMERQARRMGSPKQVATKPDLRSLIAARKAARTDP